MYLIQWIAATAAATAATAAVTALRTALRTGGYKKNVQQSRLLWFVKLLHFRQPYDHATTMNRRPSGLNMNIIVDLSSS